MNPEKPENQSPQNRNNKKGKKSRNMKAKKDFKKKTTISNSMKEREVVKKGKDIKKLGGWKRAYKEGSERTWCFWWWYGSSYYIYIVIYKCIILVCVCCVCDGGFIEMDFSGVLFKRKKNIFWSVLFFWLQKVLREESKENRLPFHIIRDPFIIYSGDDDDYV